MNYKFCNKCRSEYYKYAISDSISKEFKNMMVKPVLSREWNSWFCPVTGKEVDKTGDAPDGCHYELEEMFYKELPWYKKIDEKLYKFIGYIF